ncbi:MAG: tail fiber domain-containing protein [Sediminibacterium sp.]|nr:tail fiber domain-containing protein [Sediminibacterium sp.]
MKTTFTQTTVAFAIATLCTATSLAQQWNLGLNTVTALQANTIGTSNLSAAGKTSFGVFTNSIERAVFDGATYNTTFRGTLGQMAINTNIAGTSYMQAQKSTLGLYASPGCTTTGTSGSDMYQAARNIFMQPSVDVPGYAGASNVGRVFIGEAPFSPSGISFLPKLLVRGGGSVSASCGSVPNPDNIGLVSLGNFGESVASGAANKWLSLGTRPSSQPGFNSYGFRAQWNNYAGDLTVQERSSGSIKDVSLTWQDGTTTLAPNTLGFNSNNGLLVQFRNGNVPSATPSNDRFTVARYSINNGTGLLEINGNLSTGVVLSPSDSRLKKEIVNMQNSLEIINRLNPVTYNYKADEYAEMGLPTYKQYGFIAQEMEKVLPTHVVDLNNGFKAVNYVMLIPILTKGMQEMNGVVSALKQEINSLKSENNELLKELERKGIMTSGGTGSFNDQFFQNKPNPFNEVTTISFAFKNDQAYKIVLTDLTGKKLKEFSDLRGNGDVQITKSDLPNAGIYLYSLMTLEGEILATKQMVFEK